MREQYFSTFPTRLLLTLVLLQLFSHVTARSLQADEVSSLNAIASALRMTLKTFSSTSCSDYYYAGSSYIYCNCSYDNGTVCHVVTFSYYGLALAGELPEELGNLTYLVKIDLSNNKLHGSIPVSVGKLSSLEYLDLSSNYLQGPIPDIFTSTMLLETLLLYNNFLNGSIPKSLGALKSLYTLSLGQNLLSGTIPDDIRNISTLNFLGLKENKLTGGLPKGLGDLHQLRYLYLTSNNLTGALPLEGLDQLTNLQLFSILGNNFTGPIRPFMKNWKKLETLSLMGNNFEGPLPEEIFMLEGLQTLWVSDLRSRNEIGFPNLKKLKRLTSLILRNCSIAGQIPPYIANLQNLTYLDLSFNKLTGEIPPSVINLNLDAMYFTGNMLNGSIFHEQANLDFSYNSFTNVTLTRSNYDSDANVFACCSPNTPPMPSPSQTMDHLCHDKKSNCSSMSSLSNIMNHHCQDKISKYTSLFIDCGGGGTTIEKNYYEKDNETSSSYVSPEGNWAYSRTGDYLLSTTNPKDYIRNMTCGISVPDAPLYATARASPLSLRYHGLCLENGNYTVKLHFAEIVYINKDDYSSLGKRIFDVYIQRERVWEDFNIANEAGGPNKAVNITFPAFVENHTLEIHLLWAGKGSVYIPPGLHGPLISAISVTPVVKPHSGKLTHLSITMIVVASLAIPILVLALVWKLVWLRRKGLRDDEIKGIKFKEKCYTFRQIIDATQNFSSSMKIGQGGFGTVYKADMEDGNILAVKRLPHESIRGIGESTNEIKTLYSLEHENLVKLLGYYLVNNQLLLVYEYMEKNSLAEALFGKSFTVKLAWKDRCAICLGVAKGLRFLHVEAKPKIIHRDIKASNILLDKDFKAKISDFGMAKFYKEAGPIMATIEAGGTYGYMAPEYATRGKISEKTDVYSFGVVLLEIISGKSNAEEHPNEESVYLLDKAFVLQNDGKLLDLVDKSVVYGLDYLEKEATVMLKLAMMCTNQSYTLRPTMSDAVSVLEGEKSVEHLFLHTGPSLSSSRSYRSYFGGNEER